MIIIYWYNKFSVFGNDLDSNFVKHLIDLYHEYPKLSTINESIWIVPGTLDEKTAP